MAGREDARTALAVIEKSGKKQIEVSTVNSSFAFIACADTLVFVIYPMLSFAHNVLTPTL